MGELTISAADIEAVAGKIDAGEALSDGDRDTLRSVFLLAGKATADALEAEGDVEGFILIGLNQPSGATGSPVMGDGSVRTAFGDGSVRGAFDVGRNQMQDFHFSIQVNAATPKLG